ncbi:MAG: hypothetical protein KF688_19735 [Pirellulales bacterium]|nr:hypothetical protein [Pirellulales bacterium]
MSTALAEPPPRDELAARLRAETTGVRLSISWLGVRRTLSRAQQTEAADTFRAAREYVAANKKLLDTGHPAFQAATRVRHRAVALWKGMSLPFPEPGVRLIKRPDVAELDRRLGGLAAELAEAVRQLQERYDELRDLARVRLGRLYDPRDYPAELADEFALRWEFPPVDPPDYLRRLHPELYQRECRRVAAQFNEAVRLAEEAFLTEFRELIAHLAERLGGRADGTPKVFRDSAVANLQEFFERFGRLDVGSHDELDRLVRDAQSLLAGVDPGSLRTDATLRGEIHGELARVETALETLLVDRPRRHVLRRAK